MAELPTTLKVGPYRYQVQTDRNAAREARADGLAAFHSPARLIIGIDPDWCRDQTADSLLHEALHAVWHVVGLPVKKPLNELQDEDVVDALSTILLGVIRDNPAFVAYLQAEA